MQKLDVSSEVSFGTQPTVVANLYIFQVITSQAKIKSYESCKRYYWTKFRALKLV